MYQNKHLFLLLLEFINKRRRVTENVKRSLKPTKTIWLYTKAALSLSHTLLLFLSFFSLLFHEIYATINLYSIYDFLMYVVSIHNNEYGKLASSRDFLLLLLLQYPVFLCNPKMHNRALIAQKKKKKKKNQTASQSLNVDGGGPTDSEMATKSTVYTFASLCV